MTNFPLLTCFFFFMLIGEINGESGVKKDRNTMIKKDEEVQTNVEDLNQKHYEELKKRDEELIKNLEEMKKMDEEMKQNDEEAKRELNYPAEPDVERDVITECQQIVPIHNEGYICNLNGRKGDNNFLVSSSDRDSQASSYLFTKPVTTITTNVPHNWEFLFIDDNKNAPGRKISGIFYPRNRSAGAISLDVWRKLCCITTLIHGNLAFTSTCGLTLT
mmetsp:Transcript_8515/g.9951  ORF Transcript_8515/g.9951 Transcript_8515/m.9951 type:complete len:218 (-) Transcript_8515:160-813(-)